MREVGKPRSSKPDQSHKRSTNGIDLTIPYHLKGNRSLLTISCDQALGPGLDPKAWELPASFWLDQNIKGPAFLLLLDIRFIEAVFIDYQNLDIYYNSAI